MINHKKVEEINELLFFLTNEKNVVNSDAQNRKRGEHFMRINKTDFETVMANSEFLDYYYQLFERNDERSVTDTQLEKLHYLIQKQVALTIQKTASYSFFTQTYTRKGLPTVSGVYRAAFKNRNGSVDTQTIY